VLLGALGAAGLVRLDSPGTAFTSGDMVRDLTGVGEVLLLAFGLVACAAAAARLLGYGRPQPNAQVQELESLAQAALIDNLTRLGNHRAFQEDIKRETERRNRLGTCFSVVMLDLDGLKEINDTLGHLVGDERIRAVADALRATIRPGQTAYRTGGDEFMVLLPNERAWGGMKFAQRLQIDVAERHRGLGVTCGIAESVALESRDTILHRADLALYAAKDSHRRTVIYSDDLDPASAKPAPTPGGRRQHRIMATALARAVDAKDAGTRNHCETVSELCALIARELGLDGERIEKLRLAGLLHDVGKIGVADAVLQKPEGLDEVELGEMRSHVTIGHAIVSAAELEEQAYWILHHHEHYDGTGYPDRMRGDEIPLESRIILVADAFEAMTSDRPYRTGRSAEDALAELYRHSGTQFDPKCLAALRPALALASLEDLAAAPHGDGASEAA
jgi:diguanylate cyclase (GGDEF)-like protein/putative nucleotidyltransferase with HDIG domain